jgi:hypothetical protein
VRFIVHMLLRMGAATAGGMIGILIVLRQHGVAPGRSAEWANRAFGCHDVGS